MTIGSPYTDNLFKMFAEFISTTTSVSRLHLKFPTALLTTEADLLHAAFAKNTSINSIVLEKTMAFEGYLDALRSNTRITTLSLTEVTVTNQATAEALKNYISNSTSLYELIVEYCQIDDDSLKMLADGLKNNYSIHRIVITKELNCLWKEILLARQDSQTLWEIEVDRIPKNLGDFLAKNRSLTSITIDGDRSSFIDMADLTNGLKQNETLTELNILFSGIRNQDTIELSEAWLGDSKIKLKSIQLSYVETKYQGLEALLKAWQKNPKLALQKIDFSNNLTRQDDVNSVNKPFIEKWLKEHPMVETFDCTAESPEGDLFEFPTFDLICKKNILRKKIAAKILVVAQTLLHSNLISTCIHEESLMLDILYYMQDERDVDENYLLARAQVARIWIWSKRTNFNLAYNQQELFLEFVLQP